MCHVNVVVVVVVVTTPRSGNFPYFRTVRGVLPAKANGSFADPPFEAPLSGPIITLPPFQPSLLGSCFLLEFTRQPLLEPHRVIEDFNFHGKDSPDAGLELVTQRVTSALALPLSYPSHPMSQVGLRFGGFVHERQRIKPRRNGRQRGRQKRQEKKAISIPVSRQKDQKPKERKR